MTIRKFFYFVFFLITLSFSYATVYNEQWEKVAGHITDYTNCTLNNKSDGVSTTESCFDAINASQPLKQYFFNVSKATSVFFPLDKVYYQAKNLTWGYEFVNPNACAQGNFTITFSDGHIEYFKPRYVVSGCGGSIFTSDMSNFSYLSEVGFSNFTYSFIVENGVSYGIRNLTFWLNTNTTINEMPSVNLTFNESCISNSTVHIDLNVTAFDKENDTIYYSLNRTTMTSYQSDYTFTFDKQIGLPILYPVPDYSFVEEYYRNNYEVPIEETGIYNASMLNVMAMEKQQQGIRSMSQKGSGFGLELRNTTDASLNKSVTFRYNNLITENYYLETGIASLDNNEVIRIELLDPAFNRQIAIELNNSNNYLYMSYLNSTSQTKIGNISTNGNFQLFLIYALGNRFSLQLNTHNVSYDSGQILYPFQTDFAQGLIAGIKYIRFYYTKASHVYLEYLYTEGLHNNFIFTTTKPETFSVSEAGAQTFTLYYTDFPHLNSTYNRIDKSVNIVDCKYFVDKSFLSGDNSKKFNILNAIKVTMGTALKDFLDRTGYYELGKSFLGWLWFFALLILILGEYAVIHKVDITFPLIITSIGCLFIAWLVDYTTLEIVFAIFLCFGFASPLAAHYLGQGGRRE